MPAWFKKQTPDPRISAPLDEESAAAKLKGFLAGKSKLLSVSDIENDTELFSSGLLDSLAYIELALFLEREFHCKLPPGTSMDSLDSIAAVLSIIKTSGTQENGHE